MPISHQEYIEAGKRMEELRAKTPYATAAYYDRKSKNIIVKLSNGLGIFFSPEDAQGLEGATPTQLSDVELTPSGLGLHFEKLDADLWIPSLLEGVFGSRKWMASRLGAAGGKSRSAPKRAASRANGKLGGRPRKIIAAR